MSVQQLQLQHIESLKKSIEDMKQIVNRDTQNNEELIAQQNEVKIIMEKEQTRLAKLEQEYYDNSTTQKREVLMKKNSSQRMKQYNYFMIVIVFAISLLVFLTLIQKQLTFLPDTLFLILRIIILAVTIIWGYTILLEIENRDPLNYDKLHLEKPNVDSPEEVAKKQKEAEKQGDLLASVAGMKCTGESCCDVGTKWDSDKMMCVPATESFDTIKPNEPNDNFLKL